MFYLGGHDPLWDLAEDASSIALIEAMLGAGKPVAAVCHAPGVLRHVKKRDGILVVSGEAVTGFTNTEEEAAGLSAVVPFLVEDMLRTSGGNYSIRIFKPWAAFPFSGKSLWQQRQTPHPHVAVRRSHPRQ